MAGAGCEVAQRKGSGVSKGESIRRASSLCDDADDAIKKSSTIDNNESFNSTADGEVSNSEGFDESFNRTDESFNRKRVSIVSLGGQTLLKGASDFVGSVRFNRMDEMSSRTT